MRLQDFDVRSAMTKPKGKEAEDKKTTINCRPEAADVIRKLARHRGISIHDVLDQPDIKNFLRHLLLVELETEAKHLRDRN